MERILSRTFLQYHTSRCCYDFLRLPISGRAFVGSCCCSTNSKKTKSGTFPQPPVPDVFRYALLTRPSVSNLQHSFPVFNKSVLARYFASDSSSSSPLPPKKSKSKENPRKSPITWKNLIVIGAAAGTVLVGMQYVKKEKEEARQKAQNRKMGKARIGGDWTLTDHHGKLRSSHDFRGQWLLIYFGFTNCPDICPEEIEKIVNVIEKTDADKELPKIQPIVITVDPARDTPEALKEYCAEFSPRLLGFSGTEEQISAATRAYRVYFSAGPKDEDNDYIVDHSIISYLISPEGEFVEYFGQNKKEEEIYGSIKLHILSYLKKKGS